MYPVPKGFATNLYNDRQEWVTSAQIQYMARGNVTVWDSFYPVAYASIVVSEVVNNTSVLVSEVLYY